MRVSATLQDDGYVHVRIGWTGVVLDRNAARRMADGLIFGDREARFDGDVLILAGAAPVKKPGFVLVTQDWSGVRVALYSYRRDGGLAPRLVSAKEVYAAECQDLYEQLYAATVATIRA